MIPKPIRGTWWPQRRQLRIAVAALAFLLPPGAAEARCASYPLSFCKSQGFCVRTDTVASSGTIDDPAEQLAEGVDPVAVSQMASDTTSAAAESTGTAEADVGSLSILAESSVTGTSQSLGSATSAFPFALLRIDDLVFSGPAPSVETSLRLEVAGLVEASAANVGGDGNVSASISVELHGSLCDAVGAPLLDFIGIRGLVVQQNGGNAIQTFPTNTGILMDVPLTGDPVIVVTDPFSVPTGAPLQMELWMTASSGAVVSKSVGGSDMPSGSTLATGDFANTVSLPEPGPVFELETGFTADSAQAGIENNRLPEPGHAAMVERGRGESRDARCDARRRDPKRSQRAGC